jgi:hypothetical protein
LFCAVKTFCSYFPKFSTNHCLTLFFHPKINWHNMLRVLKFKTAVPEYGDCVTANGHTVIHPTSDFCSFHSLLNTLHYLFISLCFLAFVLQG